jgi:hypothetical protein
MPTLETVTEYARLLRCAWLNPSIKDTQTDVHEFERLHAVELMPLWQQWERDNVALMVKDYLVSRFGQRR